MKTGRSHRNPGLPSRRRVKNILGAVLLLAAVCLPAAALRADELHDCMAQALDSASPDTTIGELRRQCEEKLAVAGRSAATAEKPEALVTKRIEQERKNVLKPFTIMAHKPNYLLIGAYNRIGYNEDLYREADNNPDLELDNAEAQFQISLKFPLLVGLFNNTLDVFGAYTNRSFWQVYNTEESSPFRETNHEPEVWVQFHPDWELWGFRNTWNSFGFNHQSNGRGGMLSRSWNRLFAWLTVERGNLAMSIKPWYRLPESGDDDDNPDITDYLGHYEFWASYEWRGHVFSVMSRNNLESGFSRGAVELSWSFPFPGWPYLKGYVQYFNGYGQSLIDYNQYVNSVGIGFSLTDWL
jgi:phospholipase A1